MANANPELSGCFIGSTLDDGFLVYTVSGTASLSEIVIFAVETDNGDVSRLEEGVFNSVELVEYNACSSRRGLCVMPLSAFVRSNVYINIPVLA